MAPASVAGEEVALTASLAWGQDQPASPSAQCRLEQIGRVERRSGKVFIVVAPARAEGLDGIEAFSHLWVIYWFHGNDTPEKRRTLKVHPRGNPLNPLTGVFATRSPMRPNLLGLQVCRLVERQGNRLEVAGLDAWDGSPVLDLKPYVPQIDAVPQATIPSWAAGPPPE
ncbi:MAG: tRNA (N6-threonylcarbamoyladenosine(37)-N6)-methyltransferase TrmO [Desulfobacca sp.]|uniref:tRNA (N6-threonylcarbamoyladenosine(37)-N6)-methyltransferase TrmO n=1 Tax=Desulfobacca sp. TaxID=2067990 RepID=UPI00404B885B